MSNARATFSKGRIETFSDGIFAIIVTLLVLEIKVPHLKDPQSLAELSRELIVLLPKFAGWVISFATVCVIWVNHHRLLRIIKSVSHGVFWWNAFLLLWCSFIPFPTAVLGDYYDNPLAVSFYGIVMSFMGAAFVFLRLHVILNPDLLEGDADVRAFKIGTIWTFIFGPVLYLVGAAAAWMEPQVSFAVYFIIPAYFVFPHATKD